MISIELKNITYKYPLTDFNALDNISYEFEEGKFYGVMGPNGSGKSTLCSLIKGLIPSFYLGDISGEIEILGKPLKDWDKNELTTRVGYIFQNPFAQISGVKDTVFEEIVIGLENLNTPKEEAIERAIDIIRLIGIEDLIEQNPNELSGGQRQRVAFASILAMDTDIYVIDEPTSQLDPEGTESVFRIIEALKKSRKTVILVEHKIDLLAEYADKIIVMENGKILRSGNAEEVLTDYTLLEHGTMLPQTALFARDMEQAGKPLSGVPITVEKTYEMIKERQVRIIGGN